MLNQLKKTESKYTNKLLIEELLNLSTNFEKKRTLLLSKISEKNSKWQKYFFTRKSVNLLFSIDQFLFEFLKKLPHPRKYSDYKYQLKERKKLKLFYGSLSTKQLLKTSTQASRYPGYFSKNLLSLLERRLDVILYRSNFTQNIIHARQLIVHKKIFVNQVIVDSPSYLVTPGDIISVEQKTSLLLKNNLKSHNQYNLLTYRDHSNFLSNKKFQFNKQIEFFIKLLTKKTQLLRKMDFFSNPYSDEAQSKSFAFMKNKLAIPYTKKSVSESATNKYLKSVKDQKTFSGKNYFKKVLINIIQQNQPINSNQELIGLRLKNLFLKKPSKNHILLSLRYFGLKPLHLEISYNLMKIIYLYSPQRIYYPFYIDIDALKR